MRTPDRAQARNASAPGAPGVRMVPGVGKKPTSLRDEGRTRVIRALLENAVATRPELEKLTGLSRATVAALSVELLSAGIVDESAPLQGLPASKEPRTGRPAQLLSIRPSAAYALGVDVGHDHTKVMLCDASGAPVWEGTVPRDIDNLPQQALDDVTDMVAAALESIDKERKRVLGVGVDIAAPVDTVSGNISSASIMGAWRGIRPAHEISRRTGLPAQLLNDANAGALAERLYGGGRGCDNFIYVHLSAGIGAGVFSNGRLLLGSRGLTGEVGHIMVAPHGLVCRCGNRGCLETIAAPLAIARLLSDSWGRPVPTEELFRLVASGDSAACRAVMDAADAVGTCLAAVVNVLDPELVIVGGDLAAAGDMLLAPITRSIGRYRMPTTVQDVAVVRGELGDSAPVRGAAGMVLLNAPERLAQSGTRQ